MSLMLRPLVVDPYRCPLWPLVVVRREALPTVRREALNTQWDPTRMDLTLYKHLTFKLKLHLKWRSKMVRLCSGVTYRLTPRDLVSDERCSTLSCRLTAHTYSIHSETHSKLSVYPITHSRAVRVIKVSTVLSHCDTFILNSLKWGAPTDQQIFIDNAKLGHEGTPNGRDCHMLDW